MKTLSGSLIIFTVFLSFSCATLFNGADQQINITSQPINAQIFVDEIEWGKTPMIVTLSRKDNHIIRIEIEGYEPTIVPLKRKTSNWFMGNCLFGGLIGMGIDALTGGMYILQPEEVNTTMKHVNLETSDNNDIMIIKIVMNPDKNWKKIGQLQKL